MNSYARASGLGQEGFKGEGTCASASGKPASHDHEVLSSIAVGGIGDREGSSAPIWPSIEQGIAMDKGGRRRLMMILGQLDNWLKDKQGYIPTTNKGRQWAKEQLAQDIKCHLFGDDLVLKELAESCDRLEDSLGRMMHLQGDLWWEQEGGRIGLNRFWR